MSNLSTLILIPDCIGVKGGIALSELIKSGKVSRGQSKSARALTSRKRCRGHRSAGCPWRGVKHAALWSGGFDLVVLILCFPRQHQRFTSPDWCARHYYRRDAPSLLLLCIALMAACLLCVMYTRVHACQRLVLERGGREGVVRLRPCRLVRWQ